MFLTQYATFLRLRFKPGVRDNGASNLKHRTGFKLHITVSLNDRSIDSGEAVPDDENSPEGENT
jgi:hypothetical protein